MDRVNFKSVYEVEVAERERLKNKASNGIKIPPEERLWAQTHSVYNQWFGMDAFNIVVEHIPAKKWLLLKIKVESVSYNKTILPTIAAPANKGEIVSNFKLADIYGRERTKKHIRMLGLEISGGCREFEVEYISDLGLLSVEYECDYFDEKMKLNKSEASSTGNPILAIKREVVNDSTIRYYCKSPFSEAFDAMVFSIHWEYRLN